VRVTLNHQLADGLQFERAELGRGQVAEKVVERSQGSPEAFELMGLRAIDSPVVLFGMGPVAFDQFATVNDAADGDDSLGAGLVAAQGRRA
jgi:hypothetical protein